LALAATLCAQGPTAADLYLRARKAERAGHMAEAYLLYSQAAAMSPENKIYWQRSQAVRTRATLEAKVAPATLAAGIDTEEIPAPDVPAATAADRAETRRLLPPPELQAAPGVQNFDLRGDAKQLFEKVAEAFALKCV